MQDKKRQSPVKGVKENPGTPLSVAALCISPLATNPKEYCKHSSSRGIQRLRDQWF